MSTKLRKIRMENKKETHGFCEAIGMAESMTHGF
jgi:hypothetical protein